MTSEHFDALACEINTRLDSNYRNRYRGIPVLPNSNNAKKQRSLDEDHGDKDESKTTSSQTQPNATDKVDKKTPEESSTQSMKKTAGRPKGSKDSHKRRRRTKAEIERDRSAKK